MWSGREEESKDKQIGEQSWNHQVKSRVSKPSISQIANTDNQACVQCMRFGNRNSIGRHAWCLSFCSPSLPPLSLRVCVCVSKFRIYCFASKRRFIFAIATRLEQCCFGLRVAWDWGGGCPRVVYNENISFRIQRLFFIRPYTFTSGANFAPWHNDDAARQKMARNNTISVSIIFEIGLVLCVCVCVRTCVAPFPYLRPPEMLQMTWQENENCVARAFPKQNEFMAKIGFILMCSSLSSASSFSTMKCR